MKPVSQKILQEYFEALADTPASPQRAKQMLASYAEVRYRITGGGHCKICRAHVRHVLPVHVTKADGTEVKFDCLCQRCIEGELGTAQSAEIRLGGSRWMLKRKKKG